MFIAWKVTLNADVVGMSHKHWPHPNSTRFQKNNLGYFWPRLPKVKVLYFEHFWPRMPMVKVLFFLCHFWPRLPTVKAFDFLAFLAKDTNGECFQVFCHFWPRIPTVKVFFLGHFWPRIPTVKLLLGLGHFWPRLPTVKFFVFHGHFWPRLLLLATSDMNTNDVSYVCDLRFWAPLSSSSGKREFAFIGGNLWHPTVQAGVRTLGGNCWHGIASTSMLIHR